MGKARRRTIPLLTLLLSILFQMNCYVLAKDKSESSQSHTVSAIRACAKASRLLRKKDTEKANEQLKAALEHLAKAEAAKEVDCRFDYTMGYALLHSGKLDEAKPYIDKAAKASPNDHRPLNLRAKLCEKSKDRDGQIEALKQSVARRKHQGRILRELASALRSRGASGDEEAAKAYDIKIQEAKENAKLLKAQRGMFDKEKGGSFSSFKAVQCGPSKRASSKTSSRKKGG